MHAASRRDRVAPTRSRGEARSRCSPWRLVAPSLAGCGEARGRPRGRPGRRNGTRRRRRRQRAATRRRACGSRSSPTARPRARSGRSCATASRRPRARWTCSSTTARPTSTASSACRSSSTRRSPAGPTGSSSRSPSRASAPAIRRAAQAGHPGRLDQLGQRRLRGASACSPTSASPRTAPGCRPARRLAAAGVRRALCVNQRGRQPRRSTPAAAGWPQAMREAGGDVARARHRRR